MDKSKKEIASIAKRFIEFAERECKNNSPLYYQLSHDISEEEELLQLASNCRSRQPIPNLFLGAIHYLLLGSPEEELAHYYPSISKKDIESIPIDLVKSFCLKHEASIIPLLKNRIVQTNGINRTAYLMPIFSSLFPPYESVTLVDIGTSSGLTLNLDLYKYHYQQGDSFGKSKVKIHSDIRAGSLPKFDAMVSVKRKIGIDQNPLDLKITDNAHWLKALIWPDMLERFERMEAAIEVAQHSNIEFQKASTNQEFKAIIDQIPEHENLIIYHTHVLYQFTQEERRDFRKMLDEIGQKRDLYYLAVEANSIFDKEDYFGKGAKIELTAFQAGEKNSKILASTNGHGTWIKWL